jgi:hypothetical protein
MSAPATTEPSAASSVHGADSKVNQVKSKASASLLFNNLSSK